MDQILDNKITQLSVLEGDHVFDGGVPVLLYVQELKSCTITIGRDTEVSLLVVGKKSWDAGVQCSIKLAALGAKFTASMIESLSGEQASGLNITIAHEASNTTAWGGVRTRAQDASRSEVLSTIVIPKHIKGADSYFSHHALATAGTTRVTTVPSLEIESNEVKAGHAASVSTLDVDQLFYLESRGMDREQASRLLATGFLKSDFGHLPDALADLGSEVVDTLVS